MSGFFQRWLRGKSAAKELVAIPSEGAETIADTGETVSSMRRVRSAFSDAAVVSAGTLVSRALGFVRLMVALFVLAKIVNDVFQLANTLPNYVYDLLISTAFSAVLIPAIVKSKQAKNQNEVVTALFVVGAAGLLIVSVIATVLAPFLVRLMGFKLPAGWFAVAVGFALWCMPKIFFFGVHSLMGQYLNANERFVAYALTPALNNLVSIVGLLFFNSLYNKHSAAGIALTDPNNWDIQAIAALAVPATLGIVFQALALIPSVYRAGFRFVFPIQLRGIGISKTLREGGWATLIVGTNYLRIWAISNVSVSAFAWAAAHHTGVPAMTEYAAANLYYALPFSVLVLSVINVMFPRIVAALVDDNYDRVHLFILSYHRYLAPIAMLCTAILIGASLPLAQLLTFLSDYNPYLVAIVLAMTALKLVPATTSILNQRLLFAEGRAIRVVWVDLPAALVTVAGCYAGIQLFDPLYWLPFAVFSDVVGFYLSSLGMHYMISKPVRVPILSEIACYLWPACVGVIAIAAAFSLLSFVGFYSQGFWDLAARGIGVVLLQIAIFATIGIGSSGRRAIVNLLVRRKLD